MRKRDEIVLWPVYFDSAKTRAEGRKVPKRLGKPSPTLEIIEKALSSRGFSYSLIPEAAHPSLPWKRTGSILVKRVRQKNAFLKEVARELSRLFV